MTDFLNFGTPSISRERLELETSNSARQSKMPIFMTINRSNRNRKYNSNMADVCFLKSEVVILSKFGVDIDLKIAKRALLLKPMVDFQLHTAAIFKVLQIDMTS